MAKFDKCPCGSGVGVVDCCGSVIEGVRPARTAEELMRSRYTAYVVKNIDYLIRTTLPSERPDDLAESIRSWIKKVEWIKLHVVGREQGMADDEEGRVEFIAEYMTDTGIGRHHECSVFRQAEGEWFYVGEEFSED